MSALATSDVSRRIALVDARTHFEGELTTVLTKGPLPFLW